MCGPAPHAGAAVSPSCARMRALRPPTRGLRLSPCGSAFALTPLSRTLLCSLALLPFVLPFRPLLRVLLPRPHLWLCSSLSSPRSMAPTAHLHLFPCFFLHPLPLLAPHHLHRFPPLHLPVEAPPDSGNAPPPPRSPRCVTTATFFLSARPGPRQFWLRLRL